MHSPLVDTLLGWCWLPIAVAVHLAEGNRTALHTIIGVVFVLSFAHQPLTLGLVYGDPVQVAAHQRLYRYAPFVAAALVVVGLNVSLTLVALMAGLWNAEHTLMQRYGVMRIYGRKAGDDNGGLEKPMLIVWLVVAVAFIAAFTDLDTLIAKLDAGRTNERGIRLLAPLHTPARIGFWVLLVVALAMTARWIAAERRLGNRASIAKHLYALGTLGLLVAVMLDPIAGVAGYVAAHAIEYFSIVGRSLRGRSDDAPVARATSSTAKRALVYTGYAVAILAVMRYARGPLNGNLYTFIVLFFGALHILYDGFVWKLRRPQVAAMLGIEQPTPA